MGEQTTYRGDDQATPERFDFVSRPEEPACRKLLAYFWIFGLCNNVAYNVMLSAAHDILEDKQKSETNETLDHALRETPNSIRQDNVSSNYLECNHLSTGAILLADAVPSLGAKLFFSPILQKISYNLKNVIMLLASISGLLLVALTEQIWLTFLGVACLSFGSGFGEITFLSLTSFYQRDVVAMWSSGTGGASIFSALAYAGLTTAGLSPRMSILVMIVTPIVLFGTYKFLLPKHVVKQGKIKETDEAGFLLVEDTKNDDEITMKQKLKLIPSLLKYMIPLTLVFFTEYFINQGISELLYFKGKWLSKNEQYRWYQVAYQLGVFISRSSLRLVHIEKLWTLPVLQLLNAAILLSQVFLRFIPNMWIIFIIALWEGLLGGAVYVNAFYKMTNEIDVQHREFCLGVASVADSFGVAVSACVALPTHAAICGMNLKI